MLEFCRRVLISEAAAHKAAELARASASGDRQAQLAAATAECRARADGDPPERSPNAEADRPPPGATLSAAVDRELTTANAALPERHREALALRELLTLPYAGIGVVMGIEPTAIGPLLARARLGLRTALRGPMPSDSPVCPERDRVLGGLARRQDGETLPAEETLWLLDHLADCVGCEQCHSAMLEAGACYRAWRVPTPSVEDL